MKRLAIVAHYDPRGEAADHLLRQLDQLGTVSDQIVVASPSALTSQASAEISRRAILLRRENFGHDFGSWREALEQLDWAQGYDELLLTNDSYAGFFRPLAQIIDEMTSRPVEVWGMTKSWRHGEHVQSYFLFFTRPALASRAFRRFWADTKPATDRFTAIAHGEVGVSRAMAQSGFALGSYFEPTPAERRRANRRGLHWLRQRQRAFPARFDTLDDPYFDATRANDPAAADGLNWSSAFADAALPDGRLPLIKFDTLRYDPYWLGSGVLLDRLEQRWPEQLAGVRDFLAATAPFYPARAWENGRPARLAPLSARTYGYAARRLAGTAAW
ncbi:MAG: rhamnan synthesis F family protein [Microbacterium sp.]